MSGTESELKIKPGRKILLSGVLISVGFFIGLFIANVTNIALILILVGFVIVFLGGLFPRSSQLRISAQSRVMVVFVTVSGIIMGWLTWNCIFFVSGGFQMYNDCVNAIGYWLIGSP